MWWKDNRQAVKLCLGLSLTLIITSAFLYEQKFNTFAITQRRNLIVVMYSCRKRVNKNCNSYTNRRTQSIFLIAEKNCGKWNWTIELCVFLALLRFFLGYFRIYILAEISRSLATNWLRSLEKWYPFWYSWTLKVHSFAQLPALKGLSEVQMLDIF